MRTLNKGHEETISEIIRLNKDNIGSASHDNTLRIWNWRLGVCERIFQGHDLPILCLTKVNDDLIATGGDDCTIKLWEWQKPTTSVLNKNSVFC